MKIKNFLLKNLGLRLIALLLAVFVWAMITGRERSNLQKSIDVNVEYTGVSDNIDVRTVNPDKVRLKIEGTSNVLDKITPEDFKIRIDLKRVSEGTRLNVFTEDFLEYPQNIRIVSVHPRMIEITTVELYTRDVPIKVLYKGQLQPGIRLVEKRIVPDHIKIYGYKSQIKTIQSVETADSVNLEDIKQTTVIKLRLKKEKDIIKFVDAPDVVELYLMVENTDRNNK